LRAALRQAGDASMVALGINGATSESARLTELSGGLPCRLNKTASLDLLSVAVSVAAVPVNHPRDHEYAPYRHAPDNPGCCRTRSDARPTPAPKQ
jgi:hypothetical protein